MGWGEGLTGLLAFMTQVCLVLLLGYTLANTRPVHRLLTGIASVPRTPVAAYGFVTVVAGLASLISFGLGLVVGGVMAIEVARAAKERGMKLHYPLSRGIRLQRVRHLAHGVFGVGTPQRGDGGRRLLGPPGGLVDITRTTFSWWNITAAIVTLAVVTIAMMMLAPKKDDQIVMAPGRVFDRPGDGGDEARAGDNSLGDGAEGDAPAAVTTRTKRTPAEWMEGFRGFTTILGVFLGIYLVMYFGSNGFNLTLDIVNWQRPRCAWCSCWWATPANSRSSSRRWIHASARCCCSTRSTRG